MKKIQKKVIAALVGMVAATTAVMAQEAEMSFSNEIGSDVVTVTQDKTTFAGMYNQTVTDLTVGKVSAGFDIKFALNVDEDGVPTSFSWLKDDFDYYVTFSPISLLTLGLHQSINVDGSYLVVEDDNVANGNMGSDGFTVSFFPVEGLTLAASVPFGFDSDGEENILKEFNIGFGADYKIEDIGSVSLTFHNVAGKDNFGFGVYASCTVVKDLAIYAGYSYNDTDGLCDVLGKNLINASASYTIAQFTIGADYVTTSDVFYTAADVGYAVNDIVTISLGGTVNAQYSTSEGNTIVAKPAVTITPGTIGEFKVESDVSFVDGKFESISFPCYWNYSL